MTKSKTNSKKSNGGNLGFEEKLWQAADKMRGHMDPAEYKHVVLGLIFLKYISDAFEERHGWLSREAANPKSDYYSPNTDDRFRIIEDRDEYISENIFFVPKDARWSKLRNNAKQPVIGKLIDDAMIAIEKENPSLKGVLPKDYARPTLDKHTLGELIDLISTIGLGDSESRSKDILGRVYEYFLGRFASAEGKGGGEFYTPQREGHTLFIDARKMGHLIDRTHREFSDEEINRITDVYHAWREEKEAGKYKDIPGFCKSSTTEEIHAHGYVLTPGRYVGAEDIEDDGEPFDEKMKRLTAKLEEQFAESARMEMMIKRNLKGIGF